jgi:hypothetical protein
VFCKGKIEDREFFDISGIISELRSELDFIYQIKIDEIINFFETLSEFWRNNKELERKIGTSLKQMADFIKKENVMQMLNFSLRGNYRALDGFVDFEQPNYAYTCQPRGLVVHWLSGNVPILGLYSIIQAILTKNVSLVKASSKAYKELIVLLESINTIKTQNVNGSDLLRTICVVLIDRNDKNLQDILSKNADVRVAWGGHEAIETIINLKRNIFSEDIIFGPKYSYGIIDRESVSDYKNIARRLAFDASTFDQYACSSPHTIFVEKGGAVTPLEFAEELAKNMSLINEKMIRKGETDPKKKMDILSIRAKYNMIGTVFSSQNTDWTVVYDTNEVLEEACFARVVFVKPIDKLDKLENFNNRKIQSVGCALDSKKRNNIIKKITRHGVDRCPKFGDMTLYESPWDGFFPIDKMVRWVKVYK